MKIFFFLLKKYNLKFKHKNKIINNSIFYINFIFNNSKNTFQDKKYVLQIFINNLSIIYNKFIKITNNSIKLLEKFNNCNFINKEDKIELAFFYNSLIN